MLAGGGGGGNVMGIQNKISFNSREE